MTTIEHVIRTACRDDLDGSIPYKKAIYDRSGGPVEDHTYTLWEAIWDTLDALKQ